MRFAKEASVTKLKVVIGLWAFLSYETASPSDRLAFDTFCRKQMQIFKIKISTSLQWTNVEVESCIVE